MKRIISLILLLFFFAVAKAQKGFVTIVPQEPIVIGEAFQVQYFIEDGADANNFNAPAFRGFNVAAGPNIYSGTSSKANNFKQSKNYVFTLVALSTGKLLIPGATVVIYDRKIKSNNSLVEVISKQAAASRLNKDQSDNSDYFLRPGENVQQKIKQNLFLKVMVDKRTCFVGEPVLAVFKLYSRLESKSDIVKNPGFYGFTVHDLVSLADKQVTTEKVNGKLYDVHTIRKVELYPLQAGTFTIDAMEVNNKVEFSKSAVTKKTEQEIVEGVLVNNEPSASDANTEEYESDMSTEPVTIQVKPISSKLKPTSFDGAVGLFKIAAEAVQNKLSKTEGNVLEVTISGSGNFVQLNAPLVQWPAGIEGFEPSVKDSLQKNISPLTGSRTYRYAFAASRSGTFTIPAISFSFFNLDTGGYKMISTSAIQVTIDNNIKSTEITANKKDDNTTSNNNKYLVVTAVLLLLIVCLFLFLRKRGGQNKLSVNQQVKEQNAELSLSELLAPPTMLVQGDEKEFYITLRQAIWNFFSSRFNLSGSKMSKENIVSKMKESDLDKNLVDDIQFILQQCEAGIFTKAAMADDKKVLLEKTKTTLERINTALL